MSTDPTIEVTGVAQKQHWADKTFPDVEKVRPGLWSIPVPMGDIPVRYTLAYAFVAPEGVLLVDPGYADDESLAALRTGYEKAGVTLADTIGVLITHAHLDHFGLARAVQQESGAWVGMHQDDVAVLTSALARTAEDERASLTPWGVPAELTDEMLWSSTEHGERMPLPEWNKQISDGMVIRHGDRDFVLITTPGHTAGHTCIYVPQDDVLLIGDHVLPRISSHVGDPAWHAEPPALARYSDSLHKLTQYASAEVLPAHEYRFRDIAARVAQLEVHHAERSDEIVDALRSLADETTWEIAKQLTWSRGWDALNSHSLRMAVAETSSHLNLLREQGRVVFEGTAPARYRVAAND